MASRPEFCAVCGDPAIGFHYDVASCSGCRSFFRRTIKQEKEYECKREGECMVERHLERANCRACRLDACIEAGMNPKALQSADIDIPNNKLAQMIVERQLIKRAAAVALIRPSTSVSVEDRMQGLIDELVLAKQAHDRIRSSIFSPTPFDRYDLDKVFNEPSKIGTHWGDMMEEGNRELVKQSIIYPIHQARAPAFGMMVGRWKFWGLADSVYSIEYMRTFPFFESLSRKDKRLLAIHSVVACSVFTRSYYSTEQRSEVTINPDGLRHNKRWATVLDLEYDCEIIMAIYRLSISEKEYAVLKAIVCTDYDIIGMSEEGRTALEQYQTACRKSLLSLVMARRGLIEGPRYFAALLLLISTLRKLDVVKKKEHKLVYHTIYRNTPYESRLVEEILYEDPLL
ncbi:hypothetical protein PENTCL1PPCAC_25452, partial [Pristionchus entomophagus]